jgi:hypothetical protein
MLAIAVAGEGLAARKASKEPPGVPSNSLTPASESRPQRSLAKPTPSVQPLSAEGRATLTRQKKSTPGETPSIGRKSRRSMKASRKAAVKAVVQPRTDLSPYGMLEDSQRYDPRPRALSAGVPNPQSLDLTHDHFQELDRNQDGKIDPVERAVGRIDIDRDLHTRTLH